MSKTKLRAYRTLANISQRRQEALDRQRVQEQATLHDLIEVAQQKADAVSQAEQNVADQIDRIAQMLNSGKVLQIAEYMSQQDYQAWLANKAAATAADRAQADAAVERQQQVLRAARAAASKNMERRKRLDERIRKIRIDIDVAQMDSDDEESEEATVTRRKLESQRRHVDADEEDHASPSPAAAPGSVSASAIEMGRHA